MQEEISLLELWQMLRRHLGKIIGLTVLGAILSVVWMIFFVQPSYVSNAELIVNQPNSGDQQNIQLNEVQTNVQLINTYRDVITADSVLKQVAEQVDNVYSVRELENAISVNQAQNSQAFEVSVTLDNPENAQTVLNILIMIFGETLIEIYKGEEPNIFVLSEATYNPDPVSPSLPLYLVLGAFIGLFLGLLWAIISELSDTTVKDDEFFANLGLNSLGDVSEISAKDAQATRIATTRNQRSTRK